MSPVFEADVVLVRPEIRQLGVGRIPTADARRDPAALPLRHLPVLDADRAPKDGVMVEGDVAADEDVLGGPQRLVDANAAALYGQAERLRQIEVWLDADGDQHQIHLFPLSVRQRHANNLTGARVPLPDGSARAEIDAVAAMDLRVHLTNLIP